MGQVSIKGRQVDSYFRFVVQCAPRLHSRARLATESELARRSGVPRAAYGKGGVRATLSYRLHTPGETPGEPN